MVSVTNVNEPPAFPGTLVACAGAPNPSAAIYLACYSIAEDAAAGTATLSPALGQFADPDTLDSPLQTITYALPATGDNVVSGGSAAFTVDPSTRVVQLATALDYETKRSYVLSVTATDNGSPPAAGTGSIFVAVTDVNEAPSWTTTAPTCPTGVDASLYVACLSVPELGQATVGTLPAASDPDTLATGATASYRALTYSEVTGQSGVTGDVLFSVSSGGVVTVSNGGLDFETTKSYTLAVRASDGPGLQTSIRLVYIAVTNVNEPPVLTRDAGSSAGSPTFTRSLPNDAAAGASVGAPVQAVDPEDSELFYAITGGTGQSLFAISICSGQLRLAAGATIVAGQSYTLVVRASDAQAASDSQTFTVTVVDVNDAPVLADTVWSVPENTVASAAGTYLALSATDVDSTNPSNPSAWSTLSYAIVGGNGAGIFALTQGGHLSVVAGSAALLDYENPATRTYVLTVSVTDGGSPALSDTATVTVSVTPVNEAPYFTEATSARTAAIAERTADASAYPANHPVGSPVLVSDPETLQNVGFAITASSPSAGMSLFTIDSGGQVRLTTAGQTDLDYEVASAYTLTVTITDPGALSTTGTFVVAVTNKNDPPAITSTTFAVDENKFNGYTVGTVAATDAEDGANADGLLKFTVSGGTGASAFAVHPVTGALTVVDSAQLNFESVQSFTLTVSVTDSGAPEGRSVVKSTSKQLTVTLNDLNEAPVFAAGSVFTLPLAENSGATTIVADVAAVDPDAGQAVTYAIVGGTGQSLFSIATVTVANVRKGRVTVTSPTPTLNFEATPNSFTLDVQATDTFAGAGGPASLTRTFTVQLTNENEDPTFAVSSVSLSVAKNAAFDSILGSVSCSDVDAGQVVRYEVTTATSDVSRAVTVAGVTQTYTWLTVDATTGAVKVARPGSTPYFPTAWTGTWSTAGSGPLKLVVTCYDVDAATATTRGGGTASATVFVSVTDANNAPSFAQSAYAFSVNENTVSGASSLVGAAMVATDPDAAQTLTFSLEASGNVDGAFEVFKDASGNAQLRVAGALNFEARSSYTLTVKATDNGAAVVGGSTPNLSASTVVTITIVDLNEAPTIAAQTVFYVAENALAGTAVVTAGGAAAAVVGADVDAADQPANSLRYTIQTASVPFAIADQYTGALTTVGRSLDYEAKSSWTLTVRVTDRAGAFADGVVTINVADGNDRPALADQAASVNENLPGATIATLAATDQDPGETFTYSVSRGDQFCWSRSWGATQTGVEVVPAAIADAMGTRTILARLRPATGATYTIVVSAGTAAAGDTAERYRITMSAASTAVQRCTGATCSTLTPTLVTSGVSTVFALADTPPRGANDVRAVNVFITLNPSTKTIVVGHRTKVFDGVTRPYNGADAVLTEVLRTTETANMVAFAGVSVSSDSQTSGAMTAGVTGLCFPPADAAIVPNANNLFAVDAYSGAVTVGPALDFESRAVYGFEVRVIDTGVGGSRVPAGLEECVRATPLTPPTREGRARCTVTY